jgi:hypothetical protein
MPRAPVTDPMKMLAEYVPSGPARRCWPEIGDFVCSQVIACWTKTPYQPSEQVAILGAYVAWAYMVAGQELEPEVIFHQELIEEYIVGRLDAGQYRVGALRNFRTQLYAMARVVVGPGFVPPRLTPLGPSEPTPPHTAEELVQLRNWADGQPTIGLRHDANVLIHAGAGFGPKDVELRDLRAGDITFDRYGVVAHLRGHHPRAVPALFEWEDRFEEFVSYIGDPERFLFRPNRSRDGRLVSANFQQMTSGIAPRTNLQRLRSTWIVRHLSSGTPLPALMQVAGITSLGSLERYLRFVPSIDPEELRRALRGER